MEFISLPDPPVPFFSQRVSLDDQDYTLNLEWSMRNGWYLGIKDANDEVICYPRKLVVQWDFLRNITDDRAPPGVLLLIDMSATYTEPDYNSLDKRTKLAYIPFAEAVAEGWR